MAARDRLIDSAIALLQRKGVAGTGISELLAQSGIARRSVYLNFPGGKSDLVADAARVAGQSGSELIRRLLAAADAVTAVEALVAVWKDALIVSEFRAGCPIVAAALGRFEAADAADVAGAVFADWVGLLADRIEEAGVAPETAEQVATTAIAAVEGAVIMSLAAKSAMPLERTGQQLKELVGQYTRP